MIKIVTGLIRVLFWLQAFAAPFLLSGLLSFFIFSKGIHTKDLAIILLVSGVFAGTVLAERIRRKYGLETFFSKIYGSPELDDPKKKEN
ncbi:MAG: hypothetical protein ABI675_06125 [Chitinophagaceae bacterium]